MRQLQCFVCKSGFEFSAREPAVILRHVAYGHDFAHAGDCLALASELIFPEPGYYCAAFARDPERRHVLAEPLPGWLLVERDDGTRSLEGLVRDDEWLNEPGAAMFASMTERIPLAA